MGECKKMRDDYLMYFTTTGEKRYELQKCNFERIHFLDVINALSV